MPEDTDLTIEITPSGTRRYEIQDFTHASLRQSIEEEMTRLTLDADRSLASAGAKCVLAEQARANVISNGTAADEAVAEVLKLQKLTNLLAGRKRLLQLVTLVGDDLHMRPAFLRGRFTGAEAALIPLGLQDRSTFLTSLIKSLLERPEAAISSAFALSMTVSHMEDYLGEVRPATPLEIMQLHSNLIDTDYDEETHRIVSAISNAISDSHGNPSPALTTPASNALVLEISGVHCRDASQITRLDEIRGQIAGTPGNYKLGEPTLAAALQTAIARLGAPQLATPISIMTEAEMPDGGQIFVIADTKSVAPRIILREATPENLAPGMNAGIKQTSLHLSAGLS